MNRLKSKDLVTDATDTNFSSNHMVVISNQDQPTFTEVEDLKQINPQQKIAIGYPDSVPAGTYTKQALKKIQSWDEFKDQLVYAGHVRQVLTYVESGEVDFGVVFASDALISDILTEIDTALHHPIIYQGSLLQKAGLRIRQGIS